MISKFFFEIRNLGRIVCEKLEISFKAFIILKYLLKLNLLIFNTVVNLIIADVCNF